MTCSGESDAKVSSLLVELLCFLIELMPLSGVYQNTPMSLSFPRSQIYRAVAGILISILKDGIKASYFLSRF